MDSPAKRFLWISNIVIAVLCIAAVACYFIFPLYRIDFSVKFTKELADQIAEKALVQEDGKTVGVSVDNEKAGEIAKSVISSLGEKGLSVSFSQEFHTVDFLAAFFDFASLKNVKEAKYGRALRAEALIDEAVDGFLDDAETAVSEIAAAAATVAAREVVKAQVSELINDTSGDSYDEFMADMGADGEKIDTLIDRIINAILEENATVSSVTSVVLDSAEEVNGLLLSNAKYAQYASNYDADARQYVKDLCEGVLEPFADENGRLTFKELLISMLLEMLNGALSEGVPEDIYSFTSSGRKTNSVQYQTLKAELKQTINEAFYNAAGGVLPFTVTCVMVLIGAFILIILFKLSYPVIRTLSNIGSHDPGFGFFLPVVGGFFPYLLLVAIPTLAPAMFKGLLTSGIIPNIPSEVVAAVNSVSIRYFSGSFAAFFLSIALFIFGFFYAHFRRKLRRKTKDN